jgi:hypothetical protein
MSFGTYIKFHHSIDVYLKHRTLNAAGQRYATLSYSETIPVFAQWSQSSIVNQPYQGTIDQLELFIPKNYIEKVNYEIRFKDLKDRYGNVIDSSYYEVMGIEKRMQFSGKVHHSVVSLKRVIEDHVSS